jgi:hypothetical protein
MSSGYTIVNTGVTLYSGFTFTNYLGNTHNIILPPNVTYYLAGSGVTSPSVDLVLTNLGTLDGYLNLQGCCNGDDISVAVVTGSTLAPSGVFTNMGYIGDANGVDFVYGCYKTQSISSTANFTEYTIFASGSTYIDCNDCTSNNDCDIDECCILLGATNDVAGTSLYRSLYTETILNGRQYYVFDSISGDTVVLFWDLFLQNWFLNNLTTNDDLNLGNYGFTTGYCPTQTTIPIDDLILINLPPFSAEITTTSFVCSGCSPTYCISDTGLGYDDNFFSAGTYNGDTYFSGVSTGNVIYFTTGGTWCLSTILDGTCLLEGAFPCTSICPDLCDEYVFSGNCPTPTPTPTVNCSVLDFTAIFDCEVTPTPSVTPTNTVTPTVTPTPSTTPLCPFIGVDVTITGYTPTPTPTPTITPTVTPIIDRPCEISGDVTYLTIDNEIICPVSRKFVDCANGQLYFTDSYVPTPSGDTLTPLLLFKANVDGISKCIVYVGLDFNNSGINSIQLVDGPLADLNLVEDCSSCTPDIPPTPTPSVTVTKTPTPTPTPTSSSMMGFYLYKLCSSNTYIIQTIPGPTTNNTLTFRTNASSSGECWEYISYSGIYPSLPPGATYSYITGNYFPTSGLLYFNNCTDCIFVTSEITPEG